jgi:hypothetical protein
MTTLKPIWLALSLIFVHGPDGQEIEININEISSIRDPRASEGHLHKSIHCVLYMTNGKFIGTTETCDEVDKMLAELPDVHLPEPPPKREKVK